MVVSFCSAVLDDDVLALNVAKIAQALPECLDKFGLKRGGTCSKVTDSRNMTPLLRLDGKRRGEKATRESRHEPSAAKRSRSGRVGHDYSLRRSNRRESSRMEGSISLIYR